MSRPSSTIATARFFREGEEEKLLILLNSAYGSWPRHELTVPPIEHLRWKLRSHEKAMDYHIVAELDSQIVGARLSLIRKIKIRERILLSRQGSDLAVDPDHLRSGITTRMQAFNRREFDDSFDLGIGITGHPAMVKLDTRTGFRPFGNQVQALRCNLLQSVDTNSPRTATPEAWTTTVARSFDERIDRFWEEASKPFDFIVAGTKDYLNWRYCDVRSGISQVLIAQQDDAILGFAALSLSKGKGYIVDLLCLPGRLDVADSLVSDALDRFVSTGGRTAEWWLPLHHPYMELARRWNFALKRPMPMTYQPLRAGYEFLSFLDDPKAAVHIAAGDSDVV